MCDVAPLNCTSSDTHCCSREGHPVAREERRVRWAGERADDEDDAEAAVEGADPLAPPCAWDSRRWPAGGALSMAGRLFTEGSWAIGPFKIEGGVTKKDWILKNVRSFEFSQHTVFR